MKHSKFILFFFVFLFTGETIARIDKEFDPIGNAPKIIAVGIEPSSVKQKVDNGSFIFSQDQFRVMVIGDSYIYGGGINTSKKFSKVLQNNLDRENTYGRNIIILDVSRPSNNSIDNFNTFNHYYELFRPNVVFWAYNINDIFGVLDISESKDKNNADLINKKATQPKQTIKNISYYNQFKNILYKNSLTFTLLSRKLQKELKLKGIVLPLGDFYHITKNAHKDDNREWINSKKIFIEVMRQCQQSNTKFILFKMPEFNLLGKNLLFVNIDKSFTSFTNEYKYIQYINGYKYFDANKENEYMLSKYDGHPNEVVHKIIAYKISSELLKNIVTK